uniref:uncharacterized protein LOC120332181 isoform X1 n=1 Tax=Styela clava TaxID=7725 RepID=UPI0019399C56|nr:uncharacterized protein LOC120332181 isoform X1 [Styela clava]
MAEGKHSFTLNVNINQEETKIAGEKVKQKTNAVDCKVGQLGQIVVPTPGNSQPAATQPNTLQHDLIPENVFNESEEEKVKKPSPGFKHDTEPASPSSSSDVAQSFAGMDLSGGMMDFIAFESSRDFMQKSKFEEAVHLMEDLSPSPYQQLMMSECYFQLGRERNALRCVGKLQTMMTSSPRPKIDDVIRLVGIYISGSSHIRALILLSCCAKLYKFDSNPNESVNGIMHCALECSDVIKAMAQKGDKMKAIATDVGLEKITDMLEELRSVSGAGKDNKANMEARCLKYVAWGYHAVGKHKDAIEYCEKGISLMIQTFRSNAEKYRVYGDLLNDIGSAYDDLGDYTKAESHYLKSLKAYEKVENWPNDSEKQDRTERTNKNLKNAQDNTKNNRPHKYKTIKRRSSVINQ